jgi:hypothetical protein
MDQNVIPGSPGDVAVDGDVSTYLEDLLVGVLAPLSDDLPDERRIHVELVGPHLRLMGTASLGRFRRLTDFVNHQQGLILLRNATVLRRNGTPTRVTAKDIWVSPTEVTLIGELFEGSGAMPAAEFRVPKRPEPLVVVTPGHLLTGSVFLPVDGDLSPFVESSDPAFVPMADVRTRSLADRRILSRYPFALLNRRHIVATTRLPEGMQAGHSIL